MHRTLSQPLTIQPQHDLSPIDVEAIEDRIYDHNRRATGFNDARRLAFVICDHEQTVIGAATGYTWGGTAELKQLWVDDAHRGRGHGRGLLDAFIEEAVERGVRHIWVASYDFQAPGLYERAGFERMAEFANWPGGHSHVILRKTLTPTR
jgi:ribosomal protein S18 acetylase RimI-like enzyme